MDATRGSNRRVIPRGIILVALLLVGTVLSLFATIKGADVPTGSPPPAEAPAFSSSGFERGVAEVEWIEPPATRASGMTQLRLRVEPSKSGPRKLAAPQIQYAPTDQPTTLPRAADVALTIKSGPPLPDRRKLAPTTDQVPSSIAEKKVSFLAASQPPLLLQSSSQPEPPLLPDGKEDLPMEKPSGASTSKDDKKQTLGEAPKETHTERQFLRRQSMLLGPGEYECETAVRYLIDDTDFAMAEIRDGILVIGEARRRQRLLLVPFEFRVGLSPVTQAFINVPFGWSNDEYAFAGEDEFSNAGGIGDVSAGLTRILIEGNESFPDVLGSLAFSAPTGPSSFLLSLSTPGSNLGEGFWSLTAGLTFIHTYDPVVVFYGFGYRHRFENTFDNGVTVNPGKQIFYRLGTGFAVNPRVTFSASFQGSYITENVVNGVRIAGNVQEPMYLRLAATISTGKKAKGHKSVKTIEPFVTFGLTEEAIDSMIGFSFTR